MLELDGYTDLVRIGHGGLGDVYRATRHSTGGTVAVKVLRDVSDASVAWHRTRRELTALVSLGGHAHVIQLVEVLGDTPGLVMEYAPGGSVAQLLDRRGATLALGEVVLVGRQTAEALAAAHAQGIVHRDVKPQNLLIDAFGQVKLCDFGIASLARTEEFRTRTSAISMRYASPEDLEDDAEIGPAADVYSLGATLLHLRHGAPPTLKERLAPWHPPTTDDPIAATLDAILADCLQPDPNDRPTAADVHERLERLEWQLTDRPRALPVDTAPATDGIDVADGHRHDSEADPTPATPLAAIDDPTVARTGRTPPAPTPRPVAARRRRWPTLLIGAGVAVAVVVAVALLGSQSADAPTGSEDTATTTPTPRDDSERAVTTAAPPDDPPPAVVDRPEGLVPLDDPDVVWPLGAIGECLVQQADAEALRPVACDRPHDLQRFAVGALDATTTSATEPDAAELELAVADLCLDAAPDLPLPDLRIAQTNPSPTTWRDGDRGYQCLLGVPDRRITGTLLDRRP